MPTKETEIGISATEEHDTAEEFDITVTDSHSLQESSLMIIWNQRWAIFLLLVMRLAEFGGNVVRDAAASDDNNADAFSAGLSFNDLITVDIGSFIMGGVIEYSIKHSQLQNYHESDNKPRPSVITSFIGLLLISLAATTICLPIFDNSRSILSLTLSDDSTIDNATNLTDQMFKRGVTLMFHLNWALNMLLAGFGFDISNAVIQVLRLIFIVIASETWLKPQETIDEQFDAFAWIALLSYIIPFIASIATVLSIRSPDDSGFVLADEFSLAELRRITLFKTEHSEGLYNTLYNQLNYGMSFFFAFAFALIMEYLTATWIADMVGIEAVKSMRGFFAPRLILLLGGNALLILVSRLVANAYGSIKHNTSDNQLNTITRYIFKIEKGARYFNLAMSVLALIITLALTKVIRRDFDSENKYLGRYELHFLSIMIGAVQIMNDSEEALLSAVNKITFKAVLTPISYISAVFVAWGFVEAGGEMAGLFGGMALIMLINSLLIIGYTHDRLPFANAKVHESLTGLRDRLFNQYGRNKDEQTTSSGTRLTWV